MSSKTSIDYKEVEDYDCSACDWSLHVEKATWTKFPDAHSDIMKYIQDTINQHIRENHGEESKSPMYPVSMNIEDYNSPYVTHSASPSALTILE